MDIRLVRELISLMDDNGLAELEVREEGMVIRLRKIENRVEKEIHAVHAPPPALAGGLAPAQPAPTPETNDLEIPSPMVGTFYRSPNPDSDPMLSPGDEVEPETVIGIIEAMKIMNEIPAGHKGVIREFLVVDGEAVEYGQPLATLDIRPS
jgi:acetyl-CoA carboxylase biotin carboxyl carrier protein